jgi:hypothetical protein
MRSSFIELIGKPFQEDDPALIGHGEISSILGLSIGLATVT